MVHQRDRNKRILRRIGPAPQIPEDGRDLACLYAEIGILGLEDVQAQIGAQERLGGKTDIRVDQELVEEGEASIERNVTKYSQTYRVKRTVPSDKLVKLGHSSIAEGSC